MMRAVFLRPRATALGFALCLLGAAQGHAGGTSCTPVSIGVDTSKANNSGALVLGRALGETFEAADTLVTRFTVWRVASEDSNWGIGLHPYFVETDSTAPSWRVGCPPDGYPVADRVVWEGPTKVIENGDGIHPIEFTWTFDPPLALPHRGKFAWFILQDPCAAYFDILAVDGSDPYPDGIGWYSGRSYCQQLPADFKPGTWDYIFTIEFCPTGVTPTRRTSWGQVKAIYR